MRALTLWQPWASLIAIGAKPWEFRSWRPPAALVGRRLAIHAAARPMKVEELVAMIAGLRGHPRFERPALIGEIALPFLLKALEGLRAGPATKGELFDAPPALRLPLSAIVCTAKLGEPRHGLDCAQEMGLPVDRRVEAHAQFNLGWPMLDVRPLAPPLPCRGAQGLWDAPFSEGEIVLHERAAFDMERAARAS